MIDKSKLGKTGMRVVCYIEARKITIPALARELKYNERTIRRWLPVDEPPDSLEWTSFEEDILTPFERKHGQAEKAPDINSLGSRGANDFEMIVSAALKLSALASSGSDTARQHLHRHAVELMRLSRNAGGIADLIPAELPGQLSADEQSNWFKDKKRPRRKTGTD